MNNFLSEYEMKVVTDADILLTKNKIIRKVIERFANLAEDYKDILKADQFSIENMIDPKISKGENYRGLPYVILDYPRQFGHNDTFAIRSFFWWGNFFSITLQLSGDYQQKKSSAIEKCIESNLFKDWYIGCSYTPWQHHFESDNYLPVSSKKNYNISDADHFKMAKKIPLTKWDEAELFFRQNFIFLLKMLKS